MNKKSQSLALISGIFLMLVGIFASVFIGIGLAIGNTTFSFIGSLILSVMGTLILIVEKLLT